MTDYYGKIILKVFKTVHLSIFSLTGSSPFHAYALSMGLSRHLDRLLGAPGNNIQGGGASRKGEYS